MTRELATEGLNQHHCIKAKYNFAVLFSYVKPPPQGKAYNITLLYSIKATADNSKGVCYEEVCSYTPTM